MRLFLFITIVVTIFSGLIEAVPVNKIIGGEEVVPNSLPFQVSVQRKRLLPGYAQACGGSILSPDTILTSANCIEGSRIDIFQVVAGDHNVTDESGLEQYRNLSGVLLHPSYDYGTFTNDIALLYLSEPLDLDVPSAKRINLPPPPSELDPPAGLLVQIAGWGFTSSGGSSSDVLLEAEVPIVSDSDCNTAYATAFVPNPVIPSMLCAGNTENGGVDSCQLDSGGPLFTGNGEDAVIHGLVSWGRGCGLAWYPGVYTQVSYFLDWINANINKPEEY